MKYIFFFNLQMDINMKSNKSKKQCCPIREVTRERCFLLDATMILINIIFNRNNSNSYRLEDFY